MLDSRIKEHSPRVRRAEEELKASLAEEQNKAAMQNFSLEAGMEVRPTDERRFDLDHLFKYHSPDLQQMGQYSIIRNTAKFLAQVILDNTPPGTDQTAAIHKLRDAVMTANASIALRGRI